MQREQRTYLWLIVLGGIAFGFMYVALSTFSPESSPVEKPGERTTAPEPSRGEHPRKVGTPADVPPPVGAMEQPQPPVDSSAAEKDVFPRIALPGVVELAGGVRVTFGDGRIEIDGAIAIDRGVVELLMSAGTGYDHESIVSAQFDPFDVYLCALVMGFKEGKGVRLPGEAADLSGDRVSVFAEWEQDGSSGKVAAEDLLWNVIEDGPMKRSGWVFVGSHIIRLKDTDLGGETGQQVFLCGGDPRFMTTWRHPAAVFDNPLPDAWNDGVYYANPHVVPPRGTKVKVTIERAEEEGE